MSAQDEVTFERHRSVALPLALFSSPWPRVLATASLQTALPGHLRAQATALFLLFANLVGQTSAVSLVAISTDQVWQNPLHVNRSVALVCAVSLIRAFVAIGRAARFHPRHG